MKTITVFILLTTINIVARAQNATTGITI